MRVYVEFIHGFCVGIEFASEERIVMLDLGIIRILFESEE